KLTIRNSSYDSAVVRGPRLLEFREQSGGIDPRTGQTARAVGPVRGHHGAEGKGRRGAARPQTRRRAQILSRLRARQNGNDRRGLSPDQEYTEGDRLSRFR